MSTNRSITKSLESSNLSLVPICSAATIAAAGPSSSPDFDTAARFLTPRISGLVPLQSLSRLASARRYSGPL